MTMNPPGEEPFVPAHTRRVLRLRSWDGLKRVEQSYPLGPGQRSPQIGETVIRNELEFSCYAIVTDLDAPSLGRVDFLCSHAKLSEASNHVEAA